MFLKLIVVFMLFSHQLVDSQKTVQGTLAALGLDMIKPQQIVPQIINSAKGDQARIDLAVNTIDAICPDCQQATKQIKQATDNNAQRLQQVLAIADTAINPWSR